MPASSSRNGTTTPRERAICLYKMGCKGPTTYNACSTVRWNGGVSFPIQSGHGCIGCSEDGFWDKGAFYDRLTTIKQFGVEANADKIGATAAGVVGAAIAAHAAVTTVRNLARRKEVPNGNGDAATAITNGKSA